MKSLKDHILDSTVQIKYPRQYYNPTIIDIMRHNGINETEVSDLDLKRISKILWSDAVHRNYEQWHDKIVYENLNNSYDPEELCKKIENQFEKYLAYKGTLVDNNSNIKSLSVFAKDESLKSNEDFKSLLNLYNFYISFYEKRKEGYYEIYLEPYKPEEKTDYIYNDCKGIVYRYVDDNGLKRLNRHGLVPRHDKDRYYPRYIFFVADNDKEKLKDTLSKIQTDIKKLNLHLIKIDLNKYHNKIRIFVDTASVHYDGYVTREYIPRYCCEEINPNSI